MRRMKKAGQYLLGIFAALLLCGVFSVNIVKAESQYVYDNASLLSDEEEQDLERSCTEFERNTKLHMVILTERSSGSEDCQAIADDFYDKKYPKEPNGVCFLIDMGQRQIVISTSGIMQYYMSDAEIDDILQAAQGSGTVSKPGGTDPAFFIYGDYERVAVDISVLVPMVHDAQYAVPVLSLIHI